MRSPRSSAPFWLLAFALLAGCASNPDPAKDPVEGEPPLLYSSVCSSTDGDDACWVLAGRNPSPSKTEIDVAVNPKDPLNVVVASKDMDPEASECVWAVPQVSRDGGASWETVYVGGKRAERAPSHPLFSWECVSDPALVFNRDGVLVYTLDAYRRVPTTGGAFHIGSAFYFARSTDGGRTWVSILPIHAADGNAAFHDHPRMATNPKTGSVHATWNQLGPLGAAPVPIVVSTFDGGQTATAPLYLRAPGEMPALRASAIAAGDDGHVYAFLFTRQAGSSQILLSTSTDDGRTFSQPATAFSTEDVDCPLQGSRFRCATWVEAAVDTSGGPRNGWIWATWAGTGPDGADVFVTHSSDHGRTWAEPTALNGTMNDGDQVFPRAAVDGFGVPHIVYLTRAHDPAGKLLDAEHAYLDEATQAWRRTRLTNRSFDGDLGLHQDGFSFIGDYIGIAAAGGHVYAGFPVTYSGKAEIAVARLVRNEAAPGT